MLERSEFDKLVSQYSGQVLNTALRILRDENSARDVHQEVFLAIWKYKKKLASDISWSSYLYRVTIRKAMEHIKRMKTYPQTNCQIDENCSGNKARPEDESISKEARDQLSRCISKLAGKQAEAFTLLRIEGISYPKAAMIMECKEETVRVHLHRAVKELARLMRPYFEEGR